MCIKITNRNDGILNISLNLRDCFNRTLMEGGLNQRSSFIYSQMNGAIESRLWLLSTFKQQLFFHIRQISSDVITNCKALQWAGIYLPLIIASF